MKKCVYLSGAITGLSYGEAVDWRVEATKELASANIIGISPMRAKDYLSHVTKFEGQGQYAKHGPLSTGKAIVARDHFDTINCDAILVNLLGTTKVSIGTVLEIAWAWDHNKPVIVAIEDNDPALMNCHEHVMLTELFSFRVNSLPAAYNIVKAVLGDYAR